MLVYEGHKYTRWLKTSKDIQKYLLTPISTLMRAFCTARSVPSTSALTQKLHVISCCMKLIIVFFSLFLGFLAVSQKKKKKNSLWPFHLSRRTFLESITSKIVSGLKGQFISEPGNWRNLGEWFPWYLNYPDNVSQFSTFVKFCLLAEWRLLSSSQYWSKN